SGEQLQGRGQEPHMAMGGGTAELQAGDSLLGSCRTGNLGERRADMGAASPPWFQSPTRSLQQAALPASSEQSRRLPNNVIREHCATLNEHSVRNLTPHYVHYFLWGNWIHLTLFHLKSLSWFPPHFELEGTDVGTHMKDPQAYFYQLRLKTSPRHKSFLVFGWVLLPPPKTGQNYSCPPTIENGDTTTFLEKGYTSGSFVGFKCQKNYAMEGQNRSFCDNGNWTKAPLCLGKEDTAFLGFE
ncbi:unnamed protein product, partial [Lepidochelys olivacea]